MRSVVLLFLCGGALAQQPAAQQLLRQTVSSAGGITSFRMEGKMAVEVNGKLTSEVNFTFAMSRPKSLRVSVDGPNETLSVCDGVTRSLFRAGMSSYIRTPATGIGCEASVMSWEHAGDGVTSVSFLPPTQIVFEGAPRQCQVLKLEYSAFSGLAYIPNAPSLRGAPQVKRILWIEPVRKWVLQERLEAPSRIGATVIKIAYRKIEANPALAPDTFVFLPPPGVTETNGPNGGTGAGTGVSPPGLGATAPRVIEKKDPEYTEAARQAKIEGSVLVSLTVEADGTPSHVRVTKSLQPDLDQKAIEAVNAWRFRPATKNGAPVAVPASIEINFRLLNDK